MSPSVPRPMRRLNFTQLKTMPRTHALERRKMSQVLEHLMPVFTCLSFEPLSTTATEQPSPSLLSLSEQETSSALSSSVAAAVPQSLNSTSQNAVSTPTLYTTVRGTEQATSSSTSEKVQIIANGTLLLKSTANTFLPKNLTMGSDSDSSMPTISRPQDDDGATNASMLPVLLQTVTLTTTICPSGGWV